MDEPLAAPGGTLIADGRVPDGARLPGLRLAVRDWALTACAYLAVALVLRGLTFGNPVVHIDEQFYLLIGDRMLHGALPYVDIFDRKPLGLFLLFAAIRKLGGEGFIEYQIVALLVASATALLVNRLAREIAPRAGAFWAGVGYLLYLSVFDCYGGQAPVFFNPLVALAALVVYRAWTAARADRLFVSGALAMALVGMALQIKYSVVFEGVAFGIALLARGWTAGWRPGRLLFAAAAWCMIALAPTALAFAAYAAMGHADAFFFANFVSILGRKEPQFDAYSRLAQEVAALFPLWLAIFVAPGRLGAAREGASASGHALLRAWAIAAVAGFLLFGTWYDHYVAPLLAPLCVLAAPALGRGAGEARFAWRRGWLRLSGDAPIYTRLMVGFGTLAAAFITGLHMHAHGTRAQVFHIAQLLKSRMGNGCAYINEGDPSLYMITGSCLMTRFIFQNHLNGADERNGLGVVPEREVARIMALRPPVVMIATRPQSRPTNWQSRAVVLAALSRDYTRYAVASAGNREYQLFALRPALAREAN